MKTFNGLSAAVRAAHATEAQSRAVPTTNPAARPARGLAMFTLHLDSWLRVTPDAEHPDALQIDARRGRMHPDITDASRRLQPNQRRHEPAVLLKPGDVRIAVPVDR